MSELSLNIDGFPLFRVEMIFDGRVVIEFSEETGITPRRISLSEGETFVVSGYRVTVPIGRPQEGKATLRELLLEAARRLKS